MFLKVQSKLLPLLERGFRVFFHDLQVDWKEIYSLHFKYRVPYFNIFLGGMSVWKGFKIWVKIMEIKSAEINAALY